MKFLLDTHLLLWTAALPERLPPMARDIVDDAGNEIVFSAGSIWEVAMHCRRSTGTRSTAF